MFFMVWFQVSGMAAITSHLFEHTPLMLPSQARMITSSLFRVNQQLNSGIFFKATPTAIMHSQRVNGRNNDGLGLGYFRGTDHDI